MAGVALALGLAALGACTDTLAPLDGTASLKVAHSNGLAAWTPTADVVPDSNGSDAGGDVSYVVVAGPAGPPTTNTVTATIGSGAAAAGKLFGRLVAEQP